MRTPCRYRLTWPIGVEVFLSLNPDFLPAIHFGVFDFMHTIYNFMGDMGLKFLRKSTKHPHFHSRHESGLREVLKVTGYVLKSPIEFEQRMVDADFVTLFDSQSASNQGAWVRAAFGLIHRALPVSVYRLLTRLAQYRTTVIAGDGFKLGHYRKRALLDSDWHGGSLFKPRHISVRLIFREII